LSADDAAIYKDTLDLFYQNYNDEGLLQVNQLVKRNPENTDVLALRAAFFLRLDEFDNAKEDIDLIFKLDQKNAFGYAVRSWYYEKVEEDYDQAMTDTNKAIELDPELALAYAQRASLSLRFKEEIDKFADYSKAVELEPQYVAAHANLAIEYLARTDYEAASKELDTAVEINPDSDYLYSLRGLIYLYQNNVDDAVTNFDKAIDMGYEDRDTFFYRGVALFYRAEYERAREDFTRSIDMGVENVFIYTFRGITWSFDHDYEAAAGDFVKALEINPEATEALNGAAYMYALTDKDLDTALIYANRAIGLSPDNQDYLFTLAFVYTKMENYDLAMPIYTELLENDYAYANYGLGVLHEMQGNTEEAISAYQAFLAALPDDFMSADASARVEALGGELPE
jgi:tetratricopeptide (TPR) repeat protein